MSKPKWKLSVRRHPDTQAIVEVKVGSYYCSYLGDGWEEVEPFEFDDILQPNGMSRGRSSVHFYFKSKWQFDRDLIMMATDAESMMHALVAGTHTVTEQGFKGRFKFVKRGSDVGVSPA